MADLDSLFLEILENARDDRKKSALLRDKLLELTNAGELAGDSGVSLAIAENFSRLQDVITKINGQLVELSKVRSKNAQTDDSNIFKNDEMFEEIEKAANLAQ